LWNESDFIGVFDAEADTVEYDCLLQPLMSRLSAGVDFSDIQRFLGEKITGHFGMSADLVQTAAMVERLVGWWQDDRARKITSRKEAARLLARYGRPQVMVTLLEAYMNPDAHRDLRAAIASAARQRLQAEASWSILRTAVDGSREERRAVLSAYPYTIPERYRRWPAQPPRAAHH
jgi:hypothetical protein